MFIFKTSYWSHWRLWLWKWKCLHFNNNKNNSNEKSLCWLF